MDWVIVWDVNGVLIRRRELNEEAFKIAKHLKDLGYPQYILTNQSMASLRKFEAFSESGLFKSILSALDMGMPKPDPRAFEYLKGVVGEKSICFIDNSKYNVKVAGRVGIEGVRYVNNQKLIEDLKLLGIYE